MKKIFLLVSVFLSLSVAGQAISDTATDLRTHFESWYQAAAKKAGASKRKRGIEKEVVSLYLAAVNGTEDSAGNHNSLERLTSPGNRYSLVQNELNYRVIKTFPVVDEYRPLENQVGVGANRIQDHDYAVIFNL